MDLPKAIKILSDSANVGMTTFNEEYKEAQKLLIEAGKRVIDSRRPDPYYPDRLLPGETKE